MLLDVCLNYFSFKDNVVICLFVSWKSVEADVCVDLRFNVAF